MNVTPHVIRSYATEVETMRLNKLINLESKNKKMISRETTLKQLKNFVISLIIN